ncbi:MAG TPA: hypothetical protein VK427_02030 [Kofleriaceae bacterium]|nr:hypothetical protein [Kofleriaceae bacterium]
MTPFRGGSSSEIVMRHLREAVCAPSLRCPDANIPPILERIVMRALEKLPMNRYWSAGAFAAALEVALPSLDDDGGEVTVQGHRGGRSPART